MQPKIKLHLHKEPRVTSANQPVAVVNFLASGKDFIVMTQLFNGNVISQTTYRSCGAVAAAGDLSEVENTSTQDFVRGGWRTTTQKAHTSKDLRSIDTRSGLQGLAYCRFYKVELRVSNSELLRHRQLKYRSDV